MTAIAASPQTRSPAPVRRPLKVRLKVYARVMTDIWLVLLWLPATFSGVILWETLGIVPAGPGKGERVMLWGLTTREWGEIHWWISAAAVVLTLLHIVLDWKAFKGAVRYLVHARGLPA